MPLIIDPNMEDIASLLRNETHLRGIINSTQMIVWTPSLGDHDSVIEDMMISRADILPITIYEDAIEPSIYLTGTMWNQRDAWEIAEFMESHPSIIKLASWFTVLA